MPRTNVGWSGVKIGYAKVAVDGACYLYDTSTNAVVAVTPAIHAVLEDYLRRGPQFVLRKFASRLPAENLEQAMAFLQSCRGCGMLQPLPRLNYLSVTTVSRLRELYSRGLKRMTLGVTERCNQRCRYCPFGGATSGAPRPGNMTWDAARQSIDYLLAHAAEGVVPTLDFYGGEPVLNWPVVQQAILHVRQYLQRSDVEIVLCTNATLLDRGKLELLIANKVVLQVSLDGPAHVHDGARVMADGRGTHVRVLCVLNWIRHRDPVYYRNCVRLHCTLDVTNDLLELFRYFSRPIFRDLRITFRHRTGGCPASEADRARHERQLDELANRHLRTLRNRRPFNRALFASIMQTVFRTLDVRAVGPPAKNPAPNSVCFPGQTMVFVSGDGTFYPCENCTSMGTEIGDCASGVDFGKAQRMLQAYARLCNRMCQGCWAWRLCSHCFIHSSDNDGRLSQVRKELACQREKQRIIGALRLYAYVLQNEPARASRVKNSLRHSRRLLNNDPDIPTNRQTKSEYSKLQ